VFVDVAWGAHPALLALLDTGANASAIDASRAGALPAAGTVPVVGTTGTLTAEVVAVDGLRLGALPLPTLRATRRSLAGLLSPDHRPVAMILGTDALAGMRLRLDFPRSELRLDAGGAAADGTALGLDDGIPTLAAVLHGEPAELRIDTGASLFASDDVYVNVPAAFWARLRQRDPALAPDRHFQGTGADGSTVQLPVARVGRVRIGPGEFESAWLIVQPEAGYFAAAHAKGFVSNNFLEKLCRVTLDFGHRRFVAGR
jgi:hypothetical protein